MMHLFHKYAQLHLYFIANATSLTKNATEMRLVLICYRNCSCCHCGGCCFDWPNDRVMELRKIDYDVFRGAL